LTANFAVGASPDTASTFGTFLHSVVCIACTGGKGGNPTGPIAFDVSAATGVTTASFIGNAGNFFFAADIVGNNGNTGNVASLEGGTLSGGPVPEPVSTLLIGGGLLSVGLLGKFRKALVRLATRSDEVIVDARKDDQRITVRAEGGRHGLN
jgi:hypothetical protein